MVSVVWFIEKIKRDCDDETQEKLHKVIKKKYIKTYL